MSRLVTRARSRWPIAALLAGGLIATILTLVPARAEALDADGYCAATGFFFCFKPEVGTRLKQWRWHCEATAAAPGTASRQTGAQARVRLGTRSASGCCGC